MAECRYTIKFKYLDANGVDITNDFAVLGYQHRDFFRADFFEVACQMASKGNLDRSRQILNDGYRGQNPEGISLIWEILS